VLHETEVIFVKTDIHPQWYPEARVTCACGNTWTTGSTVPEIHTDICSACHPFYTGEQRIVDTEGQVDRFLKRLKAREELITVAEGQQEAASAAQQSITELDLGTRYENVLTGAGIKTVADMASRLQEGGDEALLGIKGFGQKGLIDAKKKLRQMGFEI
jgi:large subunit ribosomal protein L31